MVGRRKLPDPSLNHIFNALSIGVQYTLSFELTNFGLKCLPIPHINSETNPLPCYRCCLQVSETVSWHKLRVLLLCQYAATLSNISVKWTSPEFPKNFLGIDLPAGLNNCEILPQNLRKLGK